MKYVKANAPTYVHFESRITAADLKIHADIATDLGLLKKAPNLGALVLATWQTLEASLFGLAIAIALGVVAGTIIGISRLADLGLMPTVEALRPIPAVAFIPLTLLMFGYGLPMEGLIVAYACVWPVARDNQDETPATIRMRRVARVG